MEILGMLVSMGLLIGGAFFFGHGGDKKDQELKSLGIGIVACCGLMLLSFAGRNWTMALGGAAATAGSYYAAIRRMREISRQEAVKYLENLELEEKYLKIEFYKECRRNGVTACRTEREIQKATLIARRMELEAEDISALFAEARTLAGDKEAEEREEKRDVLVQQERTRRIQLERYAPYHGREKRIAVLRDLRDEANADAESLRSGAVALMLATQEDERNWAAAGGFASGVAGPAAGLAVAMEIQAENARIRARNEANRKAFQPLASASLAGSGRASDRAAHYEAEIEEARIKLVAPDSPQECLERLTFRDTKVTVSETGTCTVETTAALKAPFRIFEEVDAVIDGTVLAQIRKENRIIGTAKLVLPLYGISRTCKLTGMCLTCGTPGETYTVSFTADHLWAMER